MKNKVIVSVVIVALGVLLLWTAHNMDVIGLVKQMHGG